MRGSNVRPDIASPRSARSRFGLLAAAVAVLLALTAVPAQAAPISGAIFTTDSTCDGTNVNIFQDKGDVHLDGGPAHPGAAGLPDGLYYVKVTEPNGTVLGQSNPDTPVSVVNGEFALCYQLADLVYSASSGFTTKGYDNTGNPGGEYKVWVSQNSAFPNDETKTDNFKAPDDETVPPQEDEPQLHVRKFYDANANGVKDGLEPFIVGWKVNVRDGINLDRFTPVDLVLAVDDYVVTEYLPIESNWFLTTGNNPTNVSLALNDDKTVTFGNVCTGAGGGLTLGFWSNKNGGKILSANGGSILAQVLALNLRKANGNLLGSVSLATFQSFLLNASATNMANMLSAQLAAMKANVANGNVAGSALIYAPGTNSANSNGFASVSDVIAEANTELGLNGLTLSGSPFRAYQEALKNALDNANNNKTFAQSQPCAFTFAP